MKLFLRYIYLVKHSDFMKNILCIMRIIFSYNSMTYKERTKKWITNKFLIINQRYLFFGKTIQFGAFLCLFLAVSCSSAVKKEVHTNDFRELSNQGFNIEDYDTDTRKQLAIQFVTNGSVYKQQGRYSDAIVEYIEALRWDSSSSIYLALAESYWAIDKRFSAIEYAHNAIRLDSSFIPAYELLFNIYSTSRMFQEAYTVADQILTIDPTRDNKIRYAILKGIENPRESIKLLETILTDSTDTELMFLLSSAYEQNEQFDKMVIILERLHKDQPSNYELASGLIDYYSNNNDLKNAFRIIDESEKFFEPKQVVQIYNNIGINLLSLESKSNESLIKDYIRRIDERFYFEWVTQSVTGRLSANINDSTNAEKFYDRAFKLNDTSSFLFIDAAIAYSALKMNEQSIKLLKVGKEKFPEDIRFDFYLCNAYMIEKDFDTAEIYGKSAFVADSSNVLFISIYASILQELKKYEESDRLYEKSIELDPLDANTNNNYAYSLAVRGEDLRKALKLSHTAIEKEPTNAAYLDTYGWIHFQMGKYDTALEYVQKAIETGDISSEVFEHLGDIYIKLNNKELALEAYLKSIELEENSDEVKKKIDLLRN